MFIGQRKLWTLLDNLIPAIKNGENINLRLSAPSGYGKTKMAFIIAVRIADEDDIQYELPDNDGYVYIDPTKRVIIIDEAHGVKQPELLYPIMDSRQHVFILCTNEAGELKEPFANRCIPLIFDDYELTEIEGIVEDCLKVPKSYVVEIAKNCQLNPRIAKDIVCRNLDIIFRTRYPRTVEELRDIITNVLQIENGLNLEQRRYLEYLKKVERASLDLISYAIRIDKKTIQRDIEPYLIRIDAVRITPRGRICQL